MFRFIHAQRLVPRINPQLVWFGLCGRESYTALEDGCRELISYVVAKLVLDVVGASIRIHVIVIVVIEPGAGIAELVSQMDDCGQARAHGKLAFLPPENASREARSAFGSGFSFGYTRVFNVLGTPLCVDYSGRGRIWPERLNFDGDREEGGDLGVYNRRSLRRH